MKDRAPADADRIRAFLREFGNGARVEATIYLTGGATAVLHGWRPSTIDLDIRIEPDQDDLLRLIPPLKERLGLNVELASPGDFIPELPDWRERSPFVDRIGSVTVRHYDPYAQLLSKIERGHAQDLLDIHSLLESGLVERARALELFEAIEPLLFRYPAIEPAAFRRAVEEALAG